MLNKIYSILNNIIIRLVVYYLAWLLALGGIFHLFPANSHLCLRKNVNVFKGVNASLKANQGTRELMYPLHWRKSKKGIATLVEGNLTEVLISWSHLLIRARTIPVMIALAMAFWVTLPLTWLYRWTRPRKKYNQSFVHTLLVIPIAISLVVFLVKDSIALAFSLAGIVAAVRFRTSLEEPMDSVYLLMAIGIGLAAGYATYFSGLPCLRWFLSS